ncbi:hypothetical protein [Peribacillus sp. NPDC097295]|uniref:hypothetical protein n=1 Tax=Peribacillus sp. NPDC097295 TaxID=3364402 RepID=UPI00381BB70C
MQSITNGQSVSTPTEIQGSTSLKSGQILFGKVNKIFPNQTAEVQIGQQKMIAHLDVPLQAGERYWLQVQPTEGQLVLKVLDSPNVKLSYVKGASAQLLVHLGVQSEPESAKLAEFLLRNQFPVTKEIFSSALQWVKAADTTESGLSVIKTMFTQQLPFVKDVFFALTEQAKNEPFHKLLSGLQQQITAYGTDTKTVAQLKGVLESLHITKQDQMQQTGLQRLIATWLDVKSTPEMKSGAFSLLQKTGFVPKGMSEIDFLKRTVAESVMIPETLKTPTANKLQQGLHLLANAANGTLDEAGNIESSLSKLWGGAEIGKTTSSVSTDEMQQKGVSIDHRSGRNFRLLERAFGRISSDMKPGLLTMLQTTGSQRVNGETEQVSEPLKSTKSDTLQQGIQQKPVSTEEIIHLTSRLLERAFAEVSVNGKMAAVDPEVDELLFQLNKNIGQDVESKGKVGEFLLQAFKQTQVTSHASDPEEIVLSHLMDEGFQLNDFTNGTAVAQQLKEWTKMLGLQLEHVLANQSGGGLEALTEELETLKPLLLKLLNEQHPSAVKEMAEQILNRLTAQQVLSQDNGPMQNLLLTLPLNLGSSQTDLTLQLSGRKTKDGKIDPDYCRILFYLELENLDETVIDMQIQNRVIKVTVINEQNEMIEAAASNYLDVLKDKLQAMDYKLSGVLFQNTVRAKKVGSKQNSIPFSETGTYSGVDIRI